jgi:hypothetical protein
VKRTIPATVWIVGRLWSVSISAETVCAPRAAGSGTSSKYGPTQREAPTQTMASGTRSVWLCATTVAPVARASIRRRPYSVFSTG